MKLRSQWTYHESSCFIYNIFLVRTGGSPCLKYMNAISLLVGENRACLLVWMLVWIRDKSSTFSPSKASNHLCKNSVTYFKKKKLKNYLEPIDLNQAEQILNIYQQKFSARMGHSCWIKFFSPYMAFLLITSVSPRSNLMPPELLISHWNIKSCYTAARPGATMWNNKYKRS